MLTASFKKTFMDPKTAKTQSTGVHQIPLLANALKELVELLDEELYYKGTVQKRMDEIDDTTEVSGKLISRVDYIMSQIIDLKERARQQAASIRYYKHFTTDSSNSEVEGTGATRTFHAPGVKAGCAVVASICSEGASPVGVMSASAISDYVTVRFTGDPSTDHYCMIMVIS